MAVEVLEQKALELQIAGGYVVVKMNDGAVYGAQIFETPDTQSRNI